jgi:dGTPase
MYYANTGRLFNHNIQSARVLDVIFPLNLSLQTLDGIACHNGEVELAEYVPTPLESFPQLDSMLEKCYENRANVNKLIPSTLEANVVRISDIIAYLGKDRQDAIRINVVDKDAFTRNDIGTVNGEIMNNLVVNIIENSYGKPYIKMDAEHFEALRQAKRDNYAVIYNSDAASNRLTGTVKPMMAQIYEQLLEDLKQGNHYSPVFTHHIRYVNRHATKRTTPYEETEFNQIVVDYIASMTDDYFIDLHHYLFPDSPYKVEYTGYFDKKEEKDLV